MRRAISIFVLTSVALIVPIQGATGDAGYTDIGFDQNDVGDTGMWTSGTPRGRSSGTRRGASGSPSRSALWDHLRQYWFFTVRLDTRGGRRSDATIGFFNADGPGYCYLSEVKTRRRSISKATT